MSGGQSEYNMETMAGRYAYWFKICHPKNCIYGDDTLRAYQARTAELNQRSAALS